LAFCEDSANYPRYPLAALPRSWTDAETYFLTLEAKVESLGDVKSNLGKNAVAVLNIV
jgi:hypothetical protein